MAERRNRLFRNGCNQAVRIPREFELPGDDAIIRKEGSRLIIEPIPPKSLLAILAALATLDDEFPPMRIRRHSRRTQIFSPHSPDFENARLFNFGLGEPGTIILLDGLLRHRVKSVARLHAH
jgi:antitoxin VapB